MCQKGANAEQTRLMISQAGDSLELSEQWLHQIHHLAEHAGMMETVSQIERASELIAEARGRLEAAADSVEEPGSGREASVELI